MTTERSQNLQAALSVANPNNLADALRLVNLGYMLTKVKAVFVGLTSDDDQVITSAAAKAAATITGITLAVGQNLPPIGKVVSLRVTAGAAAAGGRGILDVAGTPTTGYATLSDDGSALKFEAAVTAYVIEYYPAAAVALSTLMPNT